MRGFDLSPLFRSSVGFDHLARILDAAQRTEEQAVSYPPYNIEKVGEDNYRITMAVAGFKENEINVTSENRTLVVAGKSVKEESESGAQYLHRGIASRSFERRFDLADHISVTGASLDNGLLHIDLVREIPEALKPRRIAVEPAPQSVGAAEPKASISGEAA